MRTLLRARVGAALLALTASGLALVGGGMQGARGATPPAAQDPDPLRIGTYNIRAGVAFAAFRGAVDGLGPRVDVLGLQEIGTTERNQWLRSDVDWGYHTSSDVQQNPIVWRRERFDAVGLTERKIAEDRDVPGGPKDASWATVVRLLDRESGRQISVINVHLVKGAVKGGRPVEGREALFALYAEQVAGTVRAIRAERDVAGTDEVYILGDFNVGYVPDAKWKHKKLPYARYTALGMRSMWKGSDYLDDDLGTHSDALIDQVWTTADSTEEEIHRDLDQSDHWPAVASYQLEPVEGYTPVTGTVGFDQSYNADPVKEGTGRKRQANLAFVLVGDTDHGYPRFEFTGTAERGVLYGDGGDYTVDWSQLYDGKPGATLLVDFEGDERDEEYYETLTITLVDPAGTEITAGLESVTGTIRDDDS